MKTLENSQNVIEEVQAGPVQILKITSKINHVNYRPTFDVLHSGSIVRGGFKTLKGAQKYAQKFGA